MLDISTSVNVNRVNKYPTFYWVFTVCQIPVLSASHGLLHLFPMTVLQRYACLFSTFHSWEDYSMERLTHLPKITQQVRPGGLDQSLCSQPVQLGGLPTSPFCFSSQSYWVYIFKDTLKISTSKPVFLHGSLMPVLHQHCPWGHIWIYNPEKKYL